MKTGTKTVITTCIAFLAIGIIASTAFSRGEGKFRKWAEWKKKVSSRESKMGHERQRVSKEEIIEKFDKDGDDDLSREERENAAKWMGHERQRVSKEEIIEKFDKDGDGDLSREERENAAEWLSEEKD